MRVQEVGERGVMRHSSRKRLRAYSACYVIGMHVVARGREGEGGPPVGKRCWVVGACSAAGWGLCTTRMAKERKECAVVGRAAAAKRRSRSAM